MTAGLITAIVSVISLVAAGVAAIYARGLAGRQVESKVITVTVQAASEVVELVNAQLKRASNDYEKLSKRLDTVEAALAAEQGKTLSLNMQLGKARKRIDQLESFVKAQGWTPPPMDE